MNAPADRPGSDAHLLACTMSAWTGDPDRCRWCNDPHGKRAGSRWCRSDACDGAFGRNHWWTSARAAALARDGNRCVRCAASPDTIRDGLHVPVRLHVHHRDERAMGRHSQTSCAHHVDGLETLCDDCHKAEHARAA